MKKILLILQIFFFSTIFSLSNILEDDKCESDIHSLHSYGILSYGFHSNTFHLRNAFFRYNFNSVDERIQFFITLKGYRDTHIPETNYPSLLNNIEFYDYGVNLWIGFFYLSFRGAANYTQNPDTLLLFIPYKIQNETEFDAPQIYKDLFPSYAGIRAGFNGENFLIAYSQGDYRHMIPSGVNAKFFIKDFYIRWVSLFYHTNPLIYEPENFYFIHQLSLRKDFSTGNFILSGIIEGTYYTDGDIVLRMEEGVTYHKFTLALRELYNFKNNDFILEASIKRNFGGIFNLGIQAGTDGRWYIGTEVNF